MSIHIRRAKGAATEPDRRILAYVTKLANDTANIRGWAIAREVGDVDTIVVTFLADCEEVDRIMSGQPAAAAPRTIRRYECHGCSFATVEPERVRGHTEATGHTAGIWLADQVELTATVGGPYVVDGGTDPGAPYDASIGHVVPANGYPCRCQYGDKGLVVIDKRCKAAREAAAAAE
jgi:hypothetical protein